MTLAGIMKLALRQLDETPEDIAEYDELFTSYANMGYMIAIRQYYKPRETFVLMTDETGRADIGALPIRRVIGMKEEQGRTVRFILAADGMTIETGEKEKMLHALCEVDREPLQNVTDEPILPEYAHAALDDYICYRHLSSGSLSKQSRAEFFRDSFYRQMHALTQQGEGSVTRMKNLYAVTDARYRE